MMKSFFKNPDIQTRFEESGFVKLNLLEKEDLDALSLHYRSQTFEHYQGEEFFVSLDNANPEKAHEVTTGIEHILTPKLNELLWDYQTFAGTFIVKQSGENNCVPPHQDWTFVDESFFFSASIWIPLVDVSEENGAIGVIPGSHVLFDYPRASPSPQYKAGLTNHAVSLFPYMHLIEMKAGEVLIFNNRLIHASTPNRKNSPRVAIGIGIAPADAQLIHYYLLPNSNKRQIEVYEVDSDFFNQFSNLDFQKLFLAGNSPDNLKKIDVIKNHEAYNISEEKLIQKIKGLPDVTANDSLIEIFSGTMSTECSNQDEITPTKETQADSRTFFQKYSPGNVTREVIWRLKKKQH